MGHVFNVNLPLDKAGGVDTSGDTVTPDAMREGFTAHDADGQPITGTIPDYDGSIEQGAVEGAQNLYEQGVTDGKQAEYDAFWDGVQDYGNRTAYEQFFSPAFTEKNFFPKYIIRLVGLNRYAFRGFAFSGDLAQRLEDCKVSIDTSECTEFSGGFSAAYFVTRLPHFILIGTNLVQTFYNMQSLQTFSVTVDENTQFNSTFDRCNSLANLTIEGTIGQNGFNVSWSPLTHDSLMSIFNALKDYSEDTSGTDWIVTIGESNRAKLTDEELYIAESKGWEVK